MSKRLFLSTILLFVAANLFVKAIFIFGIDLQVQRRVGESSYGFYFVLINLCYIFQIINDFGLNLIHGTRTAEQDQIHHQRWQKIINIKVVLAILYAVVVTGIAVVLGYGEGLHLLGWLILNNILVSLILLLRAGIAGMAYYKTDAMLSVMDKALMVLICGILLLSLEEFQIEWFIWSQTASLVVTAIVAWIVSSKFISRIRSGLAAFSFRDIFREAFPYAGVVLLMYLFTRTDSIMIEQIMPDGKHSAGLYAAGFRLLDAANMIAILFGPLLIPMYVRLRNDKGETRELMKTASFLMIILTVTLSLGCFFWAEEIMALCYGHADPSWVRPFRILILSHIPIGFIFIYGSYLTAMHRMWVQIRIFIGVVVLNFVLNYLLITRLGITGAAIATAITQAIASLSLVWLTYQHLRQGANIRSVIRIIIFVLSLLVAGYLLQSLSVTWWSGIIIFCLVSGGMALLLGLFEWRGIEKLRRENERV